MITLLEKQLQKLFDSSIIEKKDDVPVSAENFFYITAVLFYYLELLYNSLDGHRRFAEFIFYPLDFGFRLLENTLGYSFGKYGFDFENGIDENHKSLAASLHLPRVIDILSKKVRAIEIMAEFEKSIENQKELQDYSETVTFHSCNYEAEKQNL